MEPLFEDVNEELPLFEVTNDAVAVCEGDGTLIHVNRRFLELSTFGSEQLIGTDIKDLLFSSSLERAIDHDLPFSLSGADCSLMLKLPDGSFIPVVVRARAVRPLRERIHRTHGKGGSTRRRILLVMRSLEEKYAYDRQIQRMLSELQAANKRLSGTLDVIMSTVGTKDLSTLLDTVLNRLTDALDAYGATVYFAEAGGFKLRGASQRLFGSFVPEFIPYGSGIPTYVLREQRACRLSVAASAGSDRLTGSFLDLDTRDSRSVRFEVAPPFASMIAVPVFFGTQVLGIVELGWKRPRAPHTYDVRVLEVVCDYLSIEMVGLVSSMRMRRTEDLTRSLNRIREFMYAEQAEGEATQRRLIADEVCRVLACRLCTVVYDRDGRQAYLDFEGGSRVPLPDSVDALFFSTTAPAARMDAASMGGGVSQSAWSCSPEDLSTVRLVRVEQSSRAGAWLASHGLPNQGVVFDAARAWADDLSPEDAACTGAANVFLLLRDATQEPIDDIEYDYLVRLAHDFEIMAQGIKKTSSERRIAQTLQAGMRSDLGSVPGITTDSLYSSATQQALVGGDFYTLIRLPDDRAVMILGDVSGKGVEAASMSALVKTALTAYAWEGASPARMVRSLNGMLMNFSRVETFATMFVAKIDLRQGRAEYCSAGHPPTMLVHPQGEGENMAGEIEVLSVQSGVVGAFESMVYENGSFSFRPGDMLFMYTDGAIEARDAHGAFFGEQRLRDVLLRFSSCGVKGLCTNVLAELDRFSGSALDDDIALVALQFDRADG